VSETPDQESSSDERAFFPLPDDLADLSEQELGQLAAELWARFVGPQARAGDDAGA